MLQTESTFPYANALAFRRLECRIDKLKSDIAVLEAWKASAIAQHPELGVDPTVIEARRKVAAIFSGKGLELKAQLVLSGEMDSSDAMRAVVSLLSGDSA